MSAVVDEIERILAAGGEADDALRAVVQVLAADGALDEAELERIAALVSAHVLIGWDTGGERWTP